MLTSTQDTGHPYDWEWAAVKFLQNADGQYIRDGIWLEQDGNHPYTNWSSIPSTFDGYASSPYPRSSRTKTKMEVMPTNLKTTTQTAIIQKPTSGNGSTMLRWFSMTITRTTVWAPSSRRAITIAMIINSTLLTVYLLIRLCLVSFMPFFFLVKHFVDFVSSCLFVWRCGLDTAKL